MRRSASVYGVVDCARESRARTSVTLRRGVSAAALLFALAGYAGAAQAQSAGGAAPPVRSAIDGNGVDLTSGQFTVSTTDVVIGQPDAGGLVHARSFHGSNWRDNHIGTIASDGTTYTVSFGGGSGTFTLTGGVFVSDQADGSSLTFNSGTQTYSFTTRDGAVAVFSKALAETAPLEANEGKVISVTTPAGEVTTYTYVNVLLGGVNFTRLQSVTNNLGYQLKFEYSVNSASTTGDLPAWRTVTKVTGFNSAVDYCDPAAVACTFSQTWPNAAYAAPTSTTRTVTDTLGRVTRFTYDVNGRITGVKRPSASTDTTIVAYDSGTGYVSTVSNGSATWTYSYVGAPGDGLIDVTDPLSHVRRVITEGGQVTFDRDGAMRGTSYAYDAAGRVSSITSPEGDGVSHAYDARGNVTTTTRFPKPGSGLANLVTSASYDASCANVIKCNKPNSTTDSNGAVTDYTYDTTHGGLLTVTQAAPTTGAVRPQTRLTYSALFAWYKNSGGAVGQAPTPVYRTTAMSACITGSSCVGTSDETKTTVVYGVAGMANNLLPTSTSSGSGDGALTATSTNSYDAVGNLLTVDGPLSGAADTVRYRYDAGRQRVGVVGPDPDGGGVLKHRGTRVAYNLDGQVTTVEAITVNSQSDGDWASPTVLQQQVAAYDGLGRQTRSSFVAGGATQSVVQYSYDAANRLDCTALRMNPSVFGSLPASACTLGTTGADGPDRISKNTYSAADEVTKVTTAYGTLNQADEVTVTYNGWG